MAHDRWSSHLALAAGRVEYTDTPLAAYRQHETNAFGVKGRGSGERSGNSRANTSPISASGPPSPVDGSDLRQFGRGAPAAERSPAAVWQALAQSYTARRDIFASQNGLARRAAALMSATASPGIGEASPRPRSGLGARLLMDRGFAACARTVAVRERALSDGNLIGAPTAVAAITRRRSVVNCDCSAGVSAARVRAWASRASGSIAACSAAPCPVRRQTCDRRSQARSSG